MAGENDLPDSEDIKKKALTRLAVAGLVTAAALGGLWWLDQGRQAPSRTAVAPPQPAPIRPAQVPAPAQPQAESLAEPGADAATETPAEAASEPAPIQAAAPREAPPPPRVINAPRLPSSAPDTPLARPPLAGVAPAPQARLAQVLPATSATGQFVVQLGVFSSPARAEELVRRLKEKGIRARTETRVHLGPFLDRQEAEKAQAEMRRLGLDGVITTAATTK